jgi:hypothetical protein
MALTDVQIRRAKAREKSKGAGEGIQAERQWGIVLVGDAAGGKLWRWAYVYEGKEKLMSFGKYSDVSLATARERHGDARKLLADRVDPMAQRKAGKTTERVASEGSFASIAAQWLEHLQHGKARVTWTRRGV